MVQKIILYWRDIPAQVIVKERRKAAKRELSKRFIEAIDRCAMKVGARDSDAYLAEWRRGEPETVSGDLEQIADEACAQLEQAFTQERLKSLVANEGKSPA